ncbi:acyl-CoA-binding protein [Penicillium alfredii]|uniref:Acyl-CoA-binding protein n=1 Tax=Penicillium alfredii TaxID=1506179 RepID=A0A9W9FL33_9EURO|nr:acyl-CoA-binding protein [Penicillium alfredii]KAJ5102147.1 acyl-CoA-binding protein [Penicillium alfredii]
MSTFEQAAADVKNLKAKPSDQEMLQLYGLYKVGTGEDFSAAKQPGAFDFAGKYKYAEWKKRVEEGLTAEEAQEQYIKLVDELKEKYGF